METFQILLLILISLLTYMFIKWYQNPLRKIPGPTGFPLFGNVFSLNPSRMHVQFYDIARKYGAVTKVYIFNVPVVLLNTTEVCLEATIKRGTDFHGRPPVPRLDIVTPKGFVFLSINDGHHPTVRRLLTRAMKAYGPGIGHLENIMQETIIEIVDALQGKDGEPIDVHELTNGYVCCVLVSMLFGEKYSYNDPTCQVFHQINEELLEATDPVNSGAILDVIPVLLNFKFILSSMQKQIRDTAKKTKLFVQQKIDEARDNFNKYQSKGCMDYFIQFQQEEFDENGNSLLDDVLLSGLISNVMVAGIETSHRSLSHALLDLLHDPATMKRLQAEIDEQFEPMETIVFKDREKLPLLEAFMYENLRYLSLAPFQIPHMTIRDTEVGGYKIPAHTRVLMNNFHTSHNPDVYEDPFTFKLERFLDEEGKLVPADHPARYNLLAFGTGRRQCPGEVLAKSRIFLFLANVLQKFNIEPVGELPDNDVRNYKVGSLLMPPTFTARFVRRQQ